MYDVLHAFIYNNYMMYKCIRVYSYRHVHEGEIRKLLLLLYTIDPTVHLYIAC